MPKIELQITHIAVDSLKATLVIRRTETDHVLLTDRKEFFMDFASYLEYVHASVCLSRERTDYRVLKPESVLENRQCQSESYNSFRK